MSRKNKIVKPTLEAHNSDGDVLTVWPGVAGTPPVIQVEDATGSVLGVLQFPAKDAPRLAEAILTAARKSQR